MFMILAYSKEVNIKVTEFVFSYCELHFLSYLFEVLHPSSQALGFVVYFKFVLHHVVVGGRKFMIPALWVGCSA